MLLSEVFPVGLKATYRRVLRVEDLQAYADLVGDDDPIHFDENFARRSVYGRPVAHGALLVGYMSAASTMATRNSDIPIASLGYDRIRFVGPAFPGETIEAQFIVVSHQEERRRIIAEIEVRCGDRVVAVARNILRTLD